MKPTNLPEGWIVAISKTYPDSTYYFNVKLNKSSWDFPTEESEDVSKGKKRKKAASDNADDYRPKTPEREMPKKAKSIDRLMLRAKRSMPGLKTDSPQQSTSASTVKETPQMQQLRAKILERQAKGNAAKKPKTVATPVVTEEKEVGVVDVKTAAQSGSDLETQKLTPQMRVLLDKMKNRQMKVVRPKSTAKSEEIIKEIPAVVPLRRPRARSMAAADPPAPNDSAKRTRRSSRLTINPGGVATSPKNADIAEDDVFSEEKRPTVPTVVPTRRNSIRDSPKVSPKKLEKTVVENKSDLVTPEKVKTPRLGRSALQKKNLAEERLAKLRESLGEEQSVVDGPSSPAATISSSPRVLLHDVVNSGDLKKSPVSIYKNAEVRMKFHQKRLNNEILYNSRMRENEGNSSSQDPIIDVPINNTLNNSDSFCEEMEWEPIEDEKIMQEIEVVRSFINTINDAPRDQQAPENSLDLTDGSQKEKKATALYIVVDTNVFLSNIGAVEEARDAVFRTHEQPVIVVPWTVIRELDFIKDDKSMTRPECLRAKARRAVRFLHQHFSAKHPRVLGQTPMDVANNRYKFDAQCPDDEILQTCLQIRFSNNCVVLLSYDKNLCNKAMIHDIVTLGRHDPLEKIDFLRAGEMKNDSLLMQHLRGEEQDDDLVPIYIKELREAEAILEEAKEILTSFLTVVVAKEMQNLYSENWERYTIMRPPWSVFAVLKCAIKHWMAAVSECFTRRAHPILKELLDTLSTTPESGRKLNDVSCILATINELLQCVNVDKYHDIMTRSSRAISVLRAKCLDIERKLEEKRLHDAIGFQRNKEEAQASKAFQQFERVYAFTRDICGLASESIGMPCSFHFKKFDPLPSIDAVKEMQPDVVANLNRLLQVLSTALEEINGLHVDHRAVIALYNALADFLPDHEERTAKDFTPLDVYCCLKTKEKLLRSGLGQLQELSGHFCRMAGFRCS